VSNKERNKAAFNILLAMLQRNFASVEDLIEMNWFPSESDFDLLNFDQAEPKLPFGLTSQIAEILLETGLFEIRIYSKHPHERWNPLTESFIEFRKRSNTVHAYYDIKSDPDLLDVKAWVEGFFI